MRRIVSVVLCAVVPLVMSGCGRAVAPHAHGAVSPPVAGRVVSAGCAVTTAAPVDPAGGRQGQTARLDGAVLLECDGRTLVVQGTYKQVMVCGEQSVLVAREEPGRVVLTMRSRVFPLPPGVLGCPQDARVGGSAQLRLKAPLNGRALVDGLTGRPIALLDDRTLQHVGYLPPGYRTDLRQPVQLSMATRPWSTQKDWSPAVKHFFAVGPLTPGEWNGGLVVTQARGSIFAGNGAPVGTVDVHGHSAEVWGDQSIRQVIWQENGWTIDVESIGPTNGTALPTAELQKIAQGMHAA